uniref:Uncharacterized protein n=1 Tax=Anguilla anguilla TaxID=7936 RepID=A0A0E9UKF1_ANGAN
MGSRGKPYPATSRDGARPYHKKLQDTFLTQPHVFVPLSS